MLVRGCFSENPQVAKLGVTVGDGVADQPISQSNSAQGVAAQKALAAVIGDRLVGVEQRGFSLNGREVRLFARSAVEGRAFCWSCNGEGTVTCPECGGDGDRGSDGERGLALPDWTSLARQKLRLARLRPRPARK
jgi:hypothetical protein